MVNVFLSEKNIPHRLDLGGTLFMTAFRKGIFFLIGCSANALAQSSDPVIDKEAQQARDQERHLILSTELLAEYQELTRTASALAEAPTKELKAKAHRHNENIKALQRELYNAATVRKSSQVPVRAVAKAERPAAKQPPNGGAANVAAYWNPYNRAIEVRSPTDSSTTPRRDAP